MADVFISYRNTPERRAFARRLATILRTHGIEVWWDYGLAEGESYRQQITDELGKARVVVPLWCSESILSKWVAMEAELGRDKLYPARLQNVAPPDAFEGIHAADLIEWNGTVGHPRLQAFVRRLCERLGKSGIAPADTLEELSELPPLAALPVVIPVKVAAAVDGAGVGLVGGHLLRGVPWKWIGATAAGVLAVTWLAAYLAGMRVGGPVGKVVEAPAPVEAAAKDSGPRRESTTDVPVGPALKGDPVAAPAVLVAVRLSNGKLRYTLPGGAVIETTKDGLESKLIRFITDKDEQIDSKLWFDFDGPSFETASAKLITPQSKVQIAAVVAIMKAYPATAVKVGCYTDNQGDPDANLKLSDNRAKRVMEEMVAGGIDADRIKAQGYGEEFPIGDNGTAEGRARNRRISLSVRAK